MRYLTAAEYRSAPTAVDTAHLVVDGTPDAQDAELLRCIDRASTWIDNTTDNPLVAAVRYRTHRAPLTRRGTLFLAPRARPLVSLEALSVGTTAADLTVVDVSGAWIEGDHFLAPLSTGSTIGLGLNAGLAAGADLLARYRFVSGWPNTVLTQSVSAAATSLHVADTAAMTAGSDEGPATVLTIVDGATTETVTVTAVTSSTVVETTAVTYGHTVAAGAVNDIAVHAMPEVIKWAAIALTSIAARSRGNDAFTMREPGPASTVDPVSTNDWLTVRDILAGWVPLR